VHAWEVCCTDLHIMDGEQFLKIAPSVPVKTDAQTYRLEDANQALDDLRQARITGAAVLDILK
jgi:propanol-preferring alcohol dehydrogenase